MVFQDPYGSLNPRMRVRELLGEGLRIRGGVSHAPKSPTRCGGIWRWSVLAPTRSRNIRINSAAGSVSGSASRAPSSCKPKVLIADEAASSLDVSVQMQILNLLLDLRDRIGLGIIFISHDMGVIEYLCDRDRGDVSRPHRRGGSAAAVLDRPRHPYTGHLIAARPRVGRRREAVGTAAADEDLAAIGLGNDGLSERCVYVERCSRALPRCRVERPALALEAMTRFACFNPVEPEPS